MNTIVGRITRNAEIRQTSNNKQVVNFSVAINDSYTTKQGERIEQATFYNCSYWINTKIAEFLTKGIWWNYWAKQAVMRGLARTEKSIRD